MDIERSRKRLLRLREELAEERAAGDAGAQRVDLDQSRMGRLSRMDALQAQAMSVEAQRRRSDHMRRIDAALRRIEDGDYGYCLSCGEAIAPARLEFDPATPLCIECATREEE